MNKIYNYIKSLLKYSPLGLGAFLGLWALHFQVVGQKWYAPTQKEVSSGIYVSTSGQNPFWLRTNQYGIVPLESQFATFRGGIYKDYRNNSPKQQKNNNTNAVPLNLSKGNSSNDEGLRQAQTDIRQTGTRLSQPDNDTVTLSLSKGNSSNDKRLRQAGTLLFQTDRKFDFGYGLSAVANVGKVNQVILPEAYLKVKYRAFEFYGGRRKEIVGLVDTTLSSGSYIWSGNALPMPKVQISIPNYTSILGKGLISIKGAYSHGWFGTQTYLKDVYLHQKWFYGRLGKPSWKVRFYAGFNHQVQWGGKLNSITRLSSIKNNQFPQSFNDYVYVVSGITLNIDERKNNLDPNDYTVYDLTNRVGNHIGTLDVGFEIQPSKNVQLMVYRQSIYDDGSLFYLANIVDGLTGISLQNHLSWGDFHLKRVTFELFNAQNQGGPLGPEQTNDYIRGRDNYFNHGQFLDGWGYHSAMIGSPFITPYSTTLSSLPRLINSYSANIPVYFFTNNNRVKATYLSSMLSYKTNDFLIKWSRSQNLGTYIAPFKNEVLQSSILLSWSKPIPKNALSMTANIGIDWGSLFKPSTGLALTINKRW